MPIVRTTRRAREAILRRPSVVAAIGLVVAVLAFQLWITAANPPGFMRDEAALAYNAYTIGHAGVDEDGARLPLYFRSFKDYKSPVYVYALSVVFLVTGPHVEVARAFAAFWIIAAVALLGLLAWRRTGRPAAGVAVLVLAGTASWLFELGRVSYEVTMVPFLVAWALLALDSVVRAGRWRPLSALWVVLPLGILTYAYAAGRVLAPLLAVALVVCLSRSRWRFVVTAWLGFAVTQIPLILYSRKHPGALTSRLDATSFVRDGMSTWDIAWQGARNSFTDLNLWRYVTSGDTKPYVHVWGAPALGVTIVVLALAGIVVIARHRRSDVFWRYVLVALVVCPIPAAATADRYHALRLAALPVLLLVLTVPAVELLVERATARPLYRALGLGLAVVMIVQLVDFVDNYRRVGPSRATLFEAGIPGMILPTLEAGAALHIDYDDRAPLVLAKWYALSRGLDRSLVVRLPDGGVAPAGAVAFGRAQECDYACTQFAHSGDYWLARSEAPAS